MKPSEIRALLLAQHNALRAQMTEAKNVAERRARGEGGDVQALLVRLVEALRAHNAKEEELMRDIFPTLDAWGPTRAEIMVEEHVHEHEKLLASLALDEQAATPAALSKVFGELLAHMEREEEVFLGTNVLADDGVEQDYFGG